MLLTTKASIFLALEPIALLNIALPNVGDAPPTEALTVKSTAVVLLPFTVGGNERAKSLPALYDDTIDRLLAALK